MKLLLPVFSFKLPKVYPDTCAPLFQGGSLNRYQWRTFVISVGYSISAYINASEHAATALMVMMILLMIVMMIMIMILLSW